MSTKTYSDERFHQIHGKIDPSQSSPRMAMSCLKLASILADHEDMFLTLFSPRTGDPALPSADQGLKARI